MTETPRTVRDLDWKKLGEFAYLLCADIFGNRPFFTVRFLAREKWIIPVLDHVLNLSAHSEEEENQEINQQDRPKDWNIEHREQSQTKADDAGLATRIPKHVLGELWLPRFIICAGGKSRPIRIHVILRCQNTNEHIEQEDAQAVRDDVKPLDEIHTKTVHRRNEHQQCPAQVNSR